MGANAVKSDDAQLMFHLSPKYVTRTLGSLKTKLPDTNPRKGQPGFAKVAEYLYGNESSGIYYALVRPHSKQFRRSLRTSDRQLANRRLAYFRNKVTHLTPCAVNLSAKPLRLAWISKSLPVG